MPNDVDTVAVRRNYRGVTMKRYLIFAVMILALSACSNDDSSNVNAPATKIETVDDLLARVCELAADCVSASQADIAACPADLLTELDTDDLAELAQFTTFDLATQTQILECFDSMICNRFGGSLSSMSDSDVMEPFRSCR